MTSAVRRAVCAIALAAPTSILAQAGQTCDLVFPNTPATRANVIRLPSGEFIAYFGGGVNAFCEGQNNRIIADSAEHFGDRGVLYLIGNVHYTEARARVDSERMTFFQREDRLNAQGSVVVTFDNGTTMTGPVADYFRVSPTRAKERLVATGRPRMNLVERDSAGRPTPAVVVDANTIVMDGDSLVYASGRVEINRTDILATSDSAFMDGRREFVRLIGTPRINGRGERPFTLEGGVIDLFSRNRQLERVLASPRGHATSQGMELFADSIDLRIRDQRLQRVFAWGPARARATSPERDVLADSLDVVMPGQRMNEVRAIGDAFATSAPDTARVIANERDWLGGDTVIVRFDTAATADTAARARARELVAIGGARSFHHVPGEGGARDQPNLNYVRGDTITVTMSRGEVEMVVVTGSASGVYLERGEDASAVVRRPVALPPVQPPRPRE